jgi:t-SNARE complex subunit (syntaxin)
MIEEQGQNLDVISDELMNTNKNLTQANENLDEAAKYQKKSRKKYVILAIIIIVLIIIAVGIVVILTQN